MAFFRNITKKQVVITALFSAVFATYFAFGFHHISDFITADEHFWVNQRIYTYWQSVFNPDKWIKTKLSDKPGVTVALVSGVGLLKESNPYEKIKAANKDPLTEPLVIRSVYTTFRIPFLVFNGAFSLFLFWVIKKLTGNFWTAFWSFSMILLSPTLLGISQITNADAVMWSFSCATILSFVCYLQTEERKFLVLSPIFLGLSLLTKLVSVIFFPFLFLLSLAFIFDRFGHWKEDGTKIHEKTLKIFKAYLVTFIASLAIFSIFMPAVFVNGKIFLDYTIGFSFMKYLVPLLILATFIMMFDAWKLKSALLIKILGKIYPYKKFIYRSVPALLLVFFTLTLANWNLGKFILDPDTMINYNRAELHFLSKFAIHKNLMYQFFPLVFSLTPIVLVSTYYLWTKFSFGKIKHEFLVLTLSLFILIFLSALVALDMPAIIRYIIALYPLAMILGGLGIAEILEIKRLQNINKALVATAIIFVSITSLWMIKPFYFNYTNSFLPKEYSIAYAWGYGGYEAAQFMNSLPNAQNLNVWSDYYGFRNFFVGSTTTDYIPKKGSKPIDYYVLTKQGQIKYDYWCNKSKNSCAKKYVPARKYYESKNPVWEMYIDERPNNFIKIFKAEQ